MRALAGVVSLLCLVPAAAPAAQFSCDEPGVLAAIAAGGGPHTFACAAPTTVVLPAELVVSQTVELDGGGLLTLSGGSAHRVIRIPPSALAVDVSLSNLGLRGGRVIYPERGSCIYAEEALSLSHVEVFDCEGQAGAIASAAVALTITDSWIHGNRDIGIQAGGFYTTEALTVTRTRIEGNELAGVSTGVPTFITESTISANRGAGILVGGAYYGGYAVILRSTIAHNVGGQGGLLVSAGDVEVAESTFAGNLPVAIHDVQSMPPNVPIDNVRIRNSTIVGHAGTNPSTIVVDPPLPPAPQQQWWYATIENSIVSGGLSGIVQSAGGNLYVPPNGCAQWGGAPTDRCASPAEANLVKLGPRGGPTSTVALRSPSAAIDSAPACTSATDQRGVARPQGAACDVGAYEWDGDIPVPALPPFGVGTLLAALVLSVARFRKRLD
jgi:hypothetical protein